MTRLKVDRVGFQQHLFILAEIFPKGFISQQI